MPVFARMTTIRRQFGNRRPPDGAILCTGCNCNLTDHALNPTSLISVVYADKIQLRINRRFDVYCRACSSRLFPKAIIL